MSPVISRSSFFTICPLVTLLFASFFATPASSCSCLPADFQNIFCSSEYSALITVKSNSSRKTIGPGLFPVTSLPLILPLSTQLPHYSSLGSRVPIESDPIRVSTVYTKRFPRETKVRRDSFHLTTGSPQEYQLIPARPLPKYPFDDSLAFPFAKTRSHSHLHFSSRSEPSSPSSSPPPAAASSSKLKRKPVVAMHEREKLIPLDGPVVRPREQMIKFNVDRFITVQSMTGKQVLLNGLAYINLRTSCAPSLRENEKYVIWGRISGNTIRLNLCNSLNYATLSQEKRQIVDSFLQGERDCKKR